MKGTSLLFKLFAVLAVIEACWLPANLLLRLRRLPSIQGVARLNPAETTKPVELTFVTWSYGVETIADNIKKFQERYPNIKGNP